jgi:hypothetical protein
MEPTVLSDNTTAGHIDSFLSVPIDEKRVDCSSLRVGQCRHERFRGSESNDSCSKRPWLGSGALYLESHTIVN